MQEISLLVTSAPHTRMAYHAYKLAETLKQQQVHFNVFFYQNAVSIANNDRWYAEDELNLRQAWQSLGIPLPVCVSASVSRGVADRENAARHHLEHHNLADGFQLVGLGTLANAIANAYHVIEF